MKICTKTCIFAGLLAVGSAWGFTVDFTSAEGYTSGNLNGQQGWSKSYGNDPVLEVDPSGSGTLNQVGAAGAVQRTFSDIEVGAAFDANASVIQYDFTYTLNSNAVTPIYNGIGWGIGGGVFSAAQLDVGILFRDNGSIQIRDGVLSGGDQNLGGTVADGTTLTVSLTVDWSNSTYSVSRSDTGDSRTDFSFAEGVGGNGGHYVRVDSSAPLDASFDSFAASAVVITNEVADYYVATGGDDLNPGTLAQPFQTIQKAADVMQAGDTCLIFGGTYRETVTPANAGTSGSPITFKAAAGENVVISGLEPISGWTNHSGNIYKADLSWSLDHEDQVFVVDGSSVTYLWEARWPNITEYTFPGLRGGFAIADGGSPSTLVDNALTQANGYWNGATVWYIGGKGGWLGKTSGISGSVPGMLTLADVDSSTQDPANGSEYYLSGILDELDMAKEWYIDAAGQKIYLWVPGGGVPNNIEVKSRVEGMVLQNKSYIHVEGIDFLAANIQLVNADHCVIDDINARYIYGSDKSLSYGATNQREGGINVVGDFNTIQNSELSYTTGSMIQLNGSGNQVVNNLIHHTTMLGNYASAIQFDTGDSHLISHNTIHDVGRCALSSTKPVNKSIIQHNRIYDYMWLSSDGAAIYFWGMDMGNSELRYNIISDGHGVLNGWGHKSTHGIYMDNGVNNVLIHHNVIYNVGDSTSHGLRFNQPGDYRIAYNNTIMDNAGLSFDTKPNGDYDPTLFGCVLNNNILTDGATQNSGLMFEGNITTGTGLNMVDPVNHDYRLSAGSTAIDYGSDDTTISDTYLTSGLGYEGSAPDAGAYEFGVAAWTAGHDFINVPTPDFTPRTSKYMNLLLGSGFDVLDDWLPTGSPSIGNFDLNKSGLNRGFRKWLQLNGSTGEGVEQTVTGLKPNTQYRLSGWVFCDSGEEIKFGVRNYGDVEMSQTAVNTAYDARRDLFFTTGASDTQATVFITKSSTGAGNVYADDFGLVEQPYVPVFSDDFAGTAIDPWWTYSYTSDGPPHDAGSQNEVLTFSRPVPNESYYFGRNDDGLGTVSNVAYVTFEISNFSIASGSGNPFFRISSEAPYYSGADTAMSVDLSANGLYQIFLNNSAGTLPYSDGGGISGSLASQTYVVYRDGSLIKSEVVDPSGSLGDNVAVNDPLTSLGWGIFANNDSIISFDIDNFELHNTVALPGAAADVPFDLFVSDYGLSGDPLADFDNDGLLDYGEYVFGDNPTNGMNDAVNPSFDAATGDLVFSLIGDDSVVAYVLAHTNLTDGTWETNQTINVPVNDGVLGVYTNAVDTSGEQLFIKLELKAP